MPLLRDGKRYAYLPQQGDALMERTRGISASLFLRHTPADVWLSLDSDIVGFTKDGIDELVEQAVEYDIVVGIYICRSVSRTYPSSTFRDGQTIEFVGDSTPQPIQWGATGCMAVHRRVFEKMAETMPLLHKTEGKRAFYPFFQTLIHQHEDEPILLSEDFAFCQRAIDLGFTVHANPALRLGHMGPYIYRLEDMAGSVLKPQPLAISKSGRYWRVACEGLTATPEEMGRLPEGKGDEIRKRFGNGRGRRNKKAVVPTPIRAGA